MPQCKNQMKNSSIIVLKLKPLSIKSDQGKNQVSSSFRMLGAMNIETTLVENCGKLRKQLKKQNFVNYHNYKVIIAKHKELFIIQENLLKEL